MNNCNIVKDLLPLYRENMLSEDSVCFVESHLKECEECKKILKDDFEIEKNEEISLDFLKREIKKEKKKYSKSIIFSCISLFVILLFYLTKPIHFEDDGKLFNINSKGENIFLTFSEQVTNVDIDENKESIFINANTTLLDKLLNKSNEITVKLDANKEIYYSNYTKIATKITSFSNSGAVELPRLVLRKFLSFISIFTSTLGLYLFCFNKSLTLKRKFQIFSIPFSCVLAYISITGIDGATYYLEKEIFYITLLSISYFVLLNSIFNIKTNRL